MAHDVNTPPKCRPGCPKGSKTKPAAGAKANHVGCPLKCHFVDGATPKNTLTGPAGKYYLIDNLFLSWTNH